MGGVTYDTGALVAGERNDRRMWALHAGFLAEEVAPVVPAPVLAEAWRGGARQASLSRLLAMCNVEPMSEEQARQVGRSGCESTASEARSSPLPHPHRTNIGGDVTVDGISLAHEHCRRSRRRNGNSRTGMLDLMCSMHYHL